MATKRRHGPDHRKTDPNYARGRGGPEFERAKAECYATETICRRCKRTVDKTLPYRNPVTGKVNIWSKTFGHKTELDRRGHPLIGHLEHWHCNTSAGASYGNAKRARQQAVKQQLGPAIDTSADWS